MHIAHNINVSYPNNFKFFDRLMPFAIDIELRNPEKFPGPWLTKISV